MRIRVKKDNIKKEINIRNIGFSYDLKIIPNNNYDIHVFINEETGIPIMDSTWRFKIYQINNDSIWLINKNGQKSLWKKNSD